MNSFKQLEPLHCAYENFSRPSYCPVQYLSFVSDPRLFSCRIFLGCCQIEFNWDFRMSYRPWVSDNLKSTVKVGREGSMSISDRKSKEAATLGSSDFLFLINNFSTYLIVIFANLIWLLFSLFWYSKILTGIFWIFLV